MRCVRGLALALIVAAVLPASALAADTPTRYSLQGGCYAVQDASGKTLAESVRMQATDLGSYMLYTKDRKYLAGKELAPADAPSPSADFTVDGPNGQDFTL